MTNVRNMTVAFVVRPKGRNLSFRYGEAVTLRAMPEGVNIQ
jgi:hypothetical protein